MTQSKNPLASRVRIGAIISLLEHEIPSSEGLGKKLRQILRSELDRLDGKKDGYIQGGDPGSVLRLLQRHVYSREEHSPLREIWSHSDKYFRFETNLALEFRNCLRKTQGYRIRVKAFHVADSDGSRPARVDVKDAQQWFADANKIFRASNVALELVFNPSLDWHEIKDTEANSWTHHSLVWKISKKYPKDIVVFFPWGNSSKNAPHLNGSCCEGGVILMPGMGDLVVDWPKLFAHELGHYFGLPHTFPNEVQDGRATPEQFLAEHGHLNGDNFTDTPWDPGVGFFNKNKWGPCDPAHHSFILSGHKMAPDRHNLMSYYRCRYYTISPQQRKHLYKSIEELKKGEQTPTYRNQCIEPNFVNTHLASLEHNQGLKVRFRALEVLITYLDSLETHSEVRAREERRRIKTQLVQMTQSDPNFRFTLVYFLSQRAPVHPSQAYSLLTGVLRTVDASLVGLLPFLEGAHERTNSREDEEAIESLWYESRAKKAKGYHLGLDLGFAHHFVSTGTGEKNYYQLSSSGRNKIDAEAYSRLPEKERVTEERHVNSTETGASLQVLATYRKENGRVEWLGQAGLTGFHGSLGFASNSQLGLKIGINYFWGDSPGALEGYVGWRAGAYLERPNHIFGYTASFFLPGLGLRAPIGDQLYLNTFAEILLEVSPEQKQQQDKQTFAFQTSLGFLYHY